MPIIQRNLYTMNRLELAGALGDLGTLLPIGIAMILLNGLNPMGVFVSVGLFYIVAGSYFGVTIPVQPMKVIGAYAIAASLSIPQIMASSLLMGALLLIIGLTGAIDVIRKITPLAVVRGVQLSTGVLLMAEGVRFILGLSKFQLLQKSAEPYLSVQYLGPLPVGILIGLIGILITLFFLTSKKYPAGLVLIGTGLAAGWLLGGRANLGWHSLGFHIPVFLPFQIPGRIDFTFALFSLVLPQIPMTLGNAVIAYTDLSKNYFDKKSEKVTNRAVCISMGLANFVSFLVGGMPLCHGAGGLAAHYRFGARTAGSNLIIGALFLGLALLLGDQLIEVFHLLPMAVLGVFLIFAGSQLALTILDIDNRKDLFVILLILSITLVINLAAGFIVGTVVAHLLRYHRFSI